MKLVAARDIRNVAKLAIKPDAEQVHTFPEKHADHIPAGTRFTIGDSEKATELSPADQEKILWLHHSKAAVQASDKSVEGIDKRVKLDLSKRAEENKPKPSMEELIASAVAKALAAAGVVKPAPATGK